MSKRKKESGSHEMRGAAWASYLELAPGELRIVQAFLNTVVDGVDEISSPTALTEWLVRWRMIAAGTPLGDQEFAKAIALRDDLRALALRRTEVDRKVAARLDRAVKGALLRIRFQDNGDTYFESARSGFKGSLARLIAMVAVARIGGRWSRFKICPGERCGLAFYDAAPNHSRKWCSMRRCGEKVKAKAFRDRHRQTSSSNDDGHGAKGMVMETALSSS